ncbi:MAG: Grx4 family monothiol glutaredoxin [Candidatus Dadabacteria bacterium]|nr:Grx4 family monothiol glutaredoxin [Candidatus Dadabacteria bacterium]
MSDIQKKIGRQIEENPIILYMKGSKEMPQCGFSAQVVNILNYYGVDYETVDVLLDPKIRQGIKDYSQWPSLPQLYVNGNFIGGCDICTDMHVNGELGEILKEDAGG